MKNSFLLGLFTLACFIPQLALSKVQADPAISTMSIEEPVAGIDFPTDSATDILSVLVLFDGVRIPTLDQAAVLEEAQAGIDYATNVPAPVWTQVQKVLVFDDMNRVPVRLSLQNGELFWTVTSNALINVKNIAQLEKAKAGIDFPTDGPENLNRDFYVAVMVDGSRIAL